jgi:Zn-dependent protease
MFWRFIDPNVNIFFIENVLGSPRPTSSILFWIFILAGLLMSIAIHEWAHAYSAHKLGDNTAKSLGRMNINPINHFDALGLGLILFTFIGYGKPVPVNPNNFANPAKGMMLVALAGPVSNFIIAIICGSLHFFITPFLSVPQSYNNGFDYLNGFFITFIYSLGLIGLYNLLLMIFNLLPINPLDGRKVFGYLHFKINDFLIKHVDHYAIFILIVCILPIFGGTSIVGILTSPFLIAYSIIFNISL